MSLAQRRRLRDEVSYRPIPSRTSLLLTLVKWKIAGCEKEDAYGNAPFWASCIHDHASWKAERIHSNVAECTLRLFSKPYNSLVYVYER